jgi:hypothetical protein
VKETGNESWRIKLHYVQIAGYKSRKRRNSPVAVSEVQITDEVVTVIDELRPHRLSDENRRRLSMGRIFNIRIAIPRLKDDRRTLQEQQLVYLDP